LKWRWLGEDATGRRQTGVDAAIDATALHARLRQRGIVPLHSRATSAAGTLNAATVHRLWPQLSSLLQAGLSLVQALELLSTDHSDAPLAELCAELSRQLNHGRSLAQAMHQMSPPFSSLAIGLIAAGEHSGQLETLVERLADHSERLLALKQRLFNATLYPLVVLAVSALVVIAMLALVVPQFETLFAGFGVGLPPLTETMVWASGALREHSTLIAVVAAVTLLALTALVRAQGAIGRWRDGWLLRLPILGAVLQRAAVTRISATLSTVLAAGLPLAQSLEVVATVAGYPRYQQALQQAGLHIMQGQPLHQALRASQGFPELMLRLTHLGEESGQLPAMLMRAATAEQAALDKTITQLTTLAEPIMIVFLGGLVAVMLIALYLPVFNLAGVMA